MISVKSIVDEHVDSACYYSVQEATAIAFRHVYEDDIQAAMSDVTLPAMRNRVLEAMYAATNISFNPEDGYE